MTQLFVWWPLALCFRPSSCACLHSPACAIAHELCDDTCGAHRLLLVPVCRGTKRPRMCTVKGLCFRSTGQRTALRLVFSLHATLIPAVPLPTWRASSHT